METPMVYSFDKIVGIDEKKLTYRDEKNNVCEIDLAECNANFIADRNADISLYRTWAGAPAPHLDASTCDGVGERDWFASNPYLCFYANPQVCFAIRWKNRFWHRIFPRIAWGLKHQKYHKAFFAIQKRLEECGWRTFDLG